MKNKILKLLTIPLILTILILPLCSWTGVDKGTSSIDFVPAYGTSLKVGYTCIHTVFSDVADPISDVIHGYIYNPQNCLWNVTDNGYSAYAFMSNYINDSLIFELDEFDLNRGSDYLSGFLNFYLNTGESSYDKINYFTKIDGRFDISFFNDISPVNYMYFYHNGSPVRNDNLELYVDTITVNEYNSYMDAWRLVTYDIQDYYNLVDYGHYGSDYEIDITTLINDIFIDSFPEYNSLEYFVVNCSGQFLNTSPYVTEPDEFDSVYFSCYVVDEKTISEYLLDDLNSYQEGYRDGSNSVPSSWAQVGTFLTDFLGAFTQAEIFPGVTIGGVLGVVVGGLLLLMFLKMFAGG